jgi:hypothetical protein
MNCTYVVSIDLGKEVLLDYVIRWAQMICITILCSIQYVIMFEKLYNTQHCVSDIDTPTGFRHHNFSVVEF